MPNYLLTLLIYIVEVIYFTVDAEDDVILEKRKAIEESLKNVDTTLECWQNFAKSIGGLICG